MGDFRLPAGTHVGYAHLRVADLARALAFYRDLAGFREIARDGETALLSASGTAPAQVILTGQPGARPKPPHTTGLYHVAIRLPHRPALARLVRRLLEKDWPFQGASDHGVSEALYLSDPDGNGLELYADRPRDGGAGRTADRDESPIRSTCPICWQAGVPLGRDRPGSRRRPYAYAGV
jgi:catechol 2,3-dioxygenase